MNKLLLATTAIAGAALVAQSAHAVAPKVTVGGFSEFQLGVISDDLDANQRSHAFRNDTEISFKVDGQTDGGLGYGGEVWLEADVTNDFDTQGTNASRTFLYLEGGWGRFEGGSNYGADQTLKIDASTIAHGTGGIDGDWYYFANPVATFAFISSPDLYLNHGGPLTGTFAGREAMENISKVTYYTPRWNGFQAGISYLPDMESRGQTVTRADNTAAQADQIFTAGVNYTGTWDQITFGLAATGEMGDAELSTYEDLRSWQAGAMLSYLGFSVAGSYGDWGDSLMLKTANADDSDYWTVGGAYEYGPYGLSVTYMDSDYATGPAAENEFDNLVVSADYKLAPGFTPYAELSMYDLDGAGVGNDNDGTVFLLGSQLNF